MEHLSRFRHLAVFFAMTAMVMILPACTVRSLMWSESGQAGPPLANGGKTRHLEKCDVASITPFPPGHRSCDYAFESQDGDRITFNEVNEEISQGLALAPQLRPHLNEFRNLYQPDTLKWIKYQQYRLYLVALRPTVIVGIPDDSANNCYAPSGRECFYVGDPKSGSRQTLGWATGVYYTKSPPIRSGSFLLIPSSKIESIELPADGVQVSVHAGDSDYLLENADGFWRFKSLQLPRTLLH